MTTPGLPTIRRMLAVCALLVFAALAHADAGIFAAVVREGDAFVVTATMDAPVSLRTAWGVLTDYEHMAGIVANLSSSRVLERHGNQLVIRQEGAVKYGLFTFAFETEREIRLEPMQRILAKNLSGSVKRMESETRLAPNEHGGVHIAYRAEIVPDSFLGRLFGGSFARDGVHDQFRLLVEEMQRRETPGAELKPATPAGH